MLGVASSQEHPKACQD